MVTFRKITENEEKIIFHYYPDGQDDGKDSHGIIEIEKSTGRILLRRKAACEVADPWYGMFAVMNIQRNYKQGVVVEEGCEFCFMNSSEEED